MLRPPVLFCKTLFADIGRSMTGIWQKYKRRSLSLIKTIWRRLFSFGSCTLYPKKHQELDISGSIGLNRTMESQIFRNRQWRHYPKQVKRKLHNHSRI